MLVKERMSHPVITVQPDMPIMDALAMMKEERIRRAPVVADGKMIGIISEKDLLNAGPSDATSLSVWEANYLLSKIKVRDVMTKKVLAVDEETPIEEAARIMADNKVGGLPVTRAGEVVGIITETNLFRVFLELMGAREKGVRVTVLAPERRGELAAITQTLTEAGGNFIAFSQFLGESPANRLITFKVSGLAEAQVRALVAPLVQEIVDMRTVG